MYHDAWSRFRLEHPYVGSSACMTPIASSSGPMYVVLMSTHHGWESEIAELEGLLSQVIALEACDAFKLGVPLPEVHDQGADTVVGMGKVGFLDKRTAISPGQL